MDQNTQRLECTGLQGSTLGQPQCFDRAWIPKHGAPRYGKIGVSRTLHNDGVRTIRSGQLVRSTGVPPLSNEANQH